MPRRILILGGARFHGRLAASLLHEQGHQISVLNRGRYRKTYEPGVVHRVADRCNPLELADALGKDEFDAVIDNNAYNGEAVTQTVRLLRNRCDHYVLTSTVAVYLRHSSDLPLHEGKIASGSPGSFSPGVLPYALGKISAEEALAREAGTLPYTQFRFPNIYGEGDFSGKIAYFDARLRDGGGILLEREVDKFSSIHVADAAAVLALAATTYKPAGRAVNVAAPSSTTYSDFFQKIFRISLSECRHRLLPAELLWKAGWSLPFPWSPPMDTSLFAGLFGPITFRDMTDWGPDALAWSRQHQAGFAGKPEFRKSRRMELAIMEKYAAY